MARIGEALMKVVIPGGSGQVGTILARAFQQAHHDVVILSRKPTNAPSKTIEWDGRSLGKWAAEIDGADVVINLAGRSVNCRYTPANRRLIMESRVQSTRLVGQAIAQASPPPPLWLQASTATIYAHRYDEPNDEFTGIVGGLEPKAPDTWRFSIDVAKAWEQACHDVVTPHTRKVLMRSAMIMSPDRGGIFDVLLRLVRFGLGGRVGDGRQFVSWIHEYDFCRAVYWLIEHGSIDGVVSLASPNPLAYAEFMRAIRKAWGRRVGLPATRWMVEIGTFLLRSESELVFKSRRVVPTKLHRAGFEFQFPDWSLAAVDLCSRWRAHRSKFQAPG